MGEVTRDTFATHVNAGLDAEDPDNSMNMRRFTTEEGRQAWDAKPAELEPDEAVRTYVTNVVTTYRELPDNGSD